jgi:hypothetical protein
VSSESGENHAACQLAAAATPTANCSLSDGLIMAQPFDFKAMELFGEAQPIPVGTISRVFGVAEQRLAPRR